MRPFSFRRCRTERILNDVHVGRPCEQKHQRDAYFDYCTASKKFTLLAPPRSGLRMRNPRGGARYYVDERDPKFSQEQPFLPRPRANSSAKFGRDESWKARREKSPLVSNTVTSCNASVTPPRCCLVAAISLPHRLAAATLLPLPRDHCHAVVV